MSAAEKILDTLLAYPTAEGLEVTEIPDVPPCRFTKITDGNGVHIITRDEQTGLEWSARDIGSFTNKAKNSAAAKACADLTLGGHSDWRLPTIEELESIRDCSRYDPAIDTDAFPDCPSAWFWSSTRHAYDPASYAWFVYFGYGNASDGNRNYNYRVRAVRGPSRQFSASLASAEGGAQ